HPTRTSRGRESTPGCVVGQALVQISPPGRARRDVGTYSVLRHPIAELRLRGSHEFSAVGEAGPTDPFAIPGRLLQSLQPYELRQPGREHEQRQLRQDHANRRNRCPVRRTLDDRRADGGPTPDPGLSAVAVLEYSQ